MSYFCPLKVICYSEARRVIPTRLGSVRTGLQAPVSSPGSYVTPRSHAVCTAAEAAVSLWAELDPCRV